LSGAANGGNLVLRPVNVATSVSSFVVPAGVTLTNSGFGNNTVTIGGTGTAKVGGLVEFVNTTGTPTISSSAALQVTGNLTSSGGLTVTLTGSGIANTFTNSGSVSVNGAVTGMDLTI